MIGKNIGDCSMKLDVPKSAIAPRRKFSSIGSVGVRTESHASNASNFTSGGFGATMYQYGDGKQAFQEYKAKNIAMNIFEEYFTDDAPNFI